MLDGKNNVMNGLTFPVVFIRLWVVDLMSLCGLRCNQIKILKFGIKT